MVLRTRQMEFMLVNSSYGRVSTILGLRLKSAMYHLQELICNWLLHMKSPIWEMTQMFQTLKRVLWPDPYLRILIRLPRGFFDFWTTRGLVLFHAPWHMSIVTTSLFSRIATPQLHTTLQQGHRRACTYRARHGSKESDVEWREWKGGE